MNIERIDRYLGVIQKIAIIIGLCASAWFFFLKGEALPHVKLVTTSRIVSQCILRVDVQAENKGGRAWQIDNAIAKVFNPSYERIQNPSNLKDLEIGTQILSLNQSLRIGEISSFGFNIKLPCDDISPLIIIRVAMKIKEEGNEWIRIVEEAVPTSNCAP